MYILRSLVNSLSMFSRLPMPAVDFKGKNMRFVMAFFPIVGVIICLFLLLWNFLCQFLGFGAFLRGVGFALLPVLITGAIHLDGFCDTVDALSSHADANKKREILKDPHTGAFAVIAVCCYMLAFAAFTSELSSDYKTVAVFGLCFVISRCLSALAVIRFPNVTVSGLAHAFSDGASKRTSCVVLIAAGIASSAAMVILGGLSAAAAVVGAIGVFAIYRFWLTRVFGGLSGDLAGWFVQVCELVSLLCLVLASSMI